MAIDNVSINYKKENLFNKKKAHAMLFPPSIQDPNFDHFETSSVSSMGTTGSMWSCFSVSTAGGYLRTRPRRPKSPFTGLTATKISCMKCGYTVSLNFIENSKI